MKHKIISNKKMRIKRSVIIKELYLQAKKQNDYKLVEVKPLTMQQILQAIKQPHIGITYSEQTPLKFLSSIKKLQNKFFNHKLKQYGK